MIRKYALKQGLLVILALLPLACSAVQGNQEQQTVPASVLSEEEKLIARDLAERELYKPENNIQPGEKIFLIKIELLPDSQADTSMRQVMVTHYRYQGNQTIRTRIDLNSHQVLQLEKAVCVPTALSQEEFTRAVELAKAEAQLVSLWSEHGSELQVEGKIGWPKTIADPTLSLRQVHLIFRVGRNYLNGPRVMVDLAKETVTVENVPVE